MWDSERSNFKAVAFAAAAPPPPPPPAVKKPTPRDPKLLTFPLSGFGFGCFGLSAFLVFGVLPMRRALLFSAWSVLLCGAVDGRYGAYAPDFFPVAGGLVSNVSVQPISLPPVTMVPVSSPLGMQIIALDQRHHHLDKKLVLAITLSSSAVVLITLSMYCVWVYWRKNRTRSGSKGVQTADSVKGLALCPILSKFNSLKLSSKKGSASVLEYKLLEIATNNFSDSNILGEGGFGCVYKARLDEGVIVAVKKLDDGGQDCEKELENEVDLLGRIQHPNIISLLGYCVNVQTRLLVYEFMQNGSLETQLHGPSHGSALTWHIRMKVALDTARGLEYLHEYCSPPVIHRDLKSSNILLDSKFNTKISDFGLAVSVGNQNKRSAKLSGTLGYVAPEYLLDGKLTEKSDVYAFGVVLLELLLGRKPVEKMAPSQCHSIVTWAMPQLTDRAKLPNIVDPVVKNTMDLKHLYQVAAVAVLCVQPEPSYRPLITDVLHSLIPLVPIELGGALRVMEPSSHANCKSSHP